MVVLSLGCPGLIVSSVYGEMILRVGSIKFLGRMSVFVLKQQSIVKTILFLKKTGKNY